MSAKTVLGGRTSVEILGFQEFMNRVDADRLKRMPPDTFEKFLPYAMALGVEHHWARAFAGIVQNPPTWYVGPTPYPMFNPIFFTNSMESMASTAAGLRFRSSRQSADRLERRRIQLRWRLFRRRLRRRRRRSVLDAVASDQ